MQLLKFAFVLAVVAPLIVATPLLADWGDRSLHRAATVAIVGWTIAVEVGVLGWLS